MIKYKPSRVKNKKNILREFNQDKYLNILNFCKTKKLISLNHIDKFHNKTSDVNNNIFKEVAKEKKIMSHYITKFSKNLNNIVDLGCGFGSKSLALIKKKAFYKKSFLLIDIAPNGIEIIKLLIKSTKKIIPKIKLEVSDFYEQKNIKTKIPINSLVFTSYSLHYKKKLNEKFLKLILRIKPKFVIHFEPIYEHYNKNTKSHKKIREYILENNYSLNLLSILKKYEKQKKIKIIYEKKNVFGVNKLLPFSIIVWQRSN